MVEQGILNISAHRTAGELHSFSIANHLEWVRCGDTRLYYRAIQLHLPMGQKLENKDGGGQNCTIVKLQG